VRAGTFYALSISWSQILTLLVVGLGLFSAPALLSLEPALLTAYCLAVVQMMGALGALLENAPAMSSNRASRRAARRCVGAMPAPGPPPTIPSRNGLIVRPSAP